MNIQNISIKDAATRLLIRLLLWDRVIFYYINLAMAWVLMDTLQHEMYKIIVYGIASIYNLVLIGEINFEKVKTEVSLGNK
jgi:hypothetical protein